MDTEVNTNVDFCTECLKADKHRKSTKSEMQLVTIPKVPWSKIAIEFVGPFNILDSNCRFIVVVSDYYSKWISFEFIPQITTDCVIHFLEKFFANEGLPDPSLIELRRFLEEQSY